MHRQIDILGFSPEDGSQSALRAASPQKITKTRSVPLSCSSPSEVKAKLTPPEKSTHSRMLPEVLLKIQASSTEKASPRGRYAHRGTSQPICDELPC